VDSNAGEEVDAAGEADAAAMLVFMLIVVIFSSI